MQSELWGCKYTNIEIFHIFPDGSLQYLLVYKIWQMLWACFQENYI
jgi:hypothetical protein